MGKIKNFFIEEVPKETPDTTVSYEYDATEDVSETVDVNTEDVSQENLVTDIYSNNDLSDTTRSIFKVEELINSLPKEMPNETKKSTVLSMLNVFGLPVEDVVADAENRTTIIKAAYDKIESDNGAVIAENAQNIEQKKNEIQDLEKDNADRATVVKDSKDKIEAEEKRIADLVTFITNEGGTQ